MSALASTSRVRLPGVRGKRAGGTTERAAPRSWSGWWSWRIVVPRQPSGTDERTVGRHCRGDQDARGESGQRFAKPRGERFGVVHEPTVVPREGGGRDTELRGEGPGGACRDLVP